jgi:hypothetical protein
MFSGFVPERAFDSAQFNSLDRIVSASFQARSAEELPNEIDESWPTADFLASQTCSSSGSRSSVLALRQMALVNRQHGPKYGTY